MLRQRQMWNKMQQQMRAEGLQRALQEMQQCHKRAKNSRTQHQLTPTQQLPTG